MQGPVGPSTKECIASIRQHLPGSELILSTWEGTDVAGLDVDHVVFNQDPGGLEVGTAQRRLVNNINRQLVSVRGGLAAATRPYAMKTRVDIRFESSAFLDEIEAYGAHGSQHLLEGRIVSCTRISVDPRRAPYPMHLSDWIHVGRRADIEKLWSAPIVGVDEARWFDTREVPAAERLWSRDSRCRYTPEQYLLVSLVKSAGGRVPEHTWDTSEYFTTMTEMVIADNFVLLEPEQFALSFTKYNWPLANWANCYSHDEWRGMYNQYCGGEPFGTVRKVRRAFRDLGSWVLVKVRGSQLARRVLKKVSI